MSTFAINSTQAGFALMRSARIGADHAWALSVFEFGEGPDFDVHVAFTGRWLRIRPGYWCNLSRDQAERIVEAIRNFKRCDGGSAPTAHETAVVIADIITEEPDIDLFAEPLLILDSQSGPVAVHASPQQTLRGQELPLNSEPVYRAGATPWTPRPCADPKPHKGRVA